MKNIDQEIAAARKKLDDVMNRDGWEVPAL